MARAGVLLRRSVPAAAAVGRAAQPDLRIARPLAALLVLPDHPQPLTDRRDARETRETFDRVEADRLGAPTAEDDIGAGGAVLLGDHGAFATRQHHQIGKAAEAVKLAEQGFGAIRQRQRVGNGLLDLGHRNHPTGEQEDGRAERTTVGLVLQRRVQPHARHPQPADLGTHPVRPGGGVQGELEKLIQRRRGEGLHRPGRLARRGVDQHFHAEGALGAHPEAHRLSGRHG
jgi:hypothetical protein